CINHVDFGLVRCAIVVVEIIVKKILVGTVDDGEVVPLSGAECVVHKAVHGGLAQAIWAVGALGFEFVGCRVVWVGLAGAEVGLGDWGWHAGRGLGAYGLV